MSKIPIDQVIVSKRNAVAKESTICLTMIVKNETKVITRLFDSCYKYIDYWVIHDTGSTDGTPEMIEKYMKEKGIPGELYHTAWKDFGYNRTQAVQSAMNKADYLLLFDADFVLKVIDDDFKTKLGRADGYLLRYHGALDYRQNLFVRASLKWYYKGVTHEFITSDEAKFIAPFDGIMPHHYADGGCRSDKFERDIELLTQGLIDEPGNGRYHFYLGQSHKDLGSTMMNKVGFKQRMVLEYRKKLIEFDKLHPAKLDAKQEKSMMTTKNQLKKLEIEISKMIPEYLEHFEKAIPNYIARAKIGGWPEECYYSYLQVGLIKQRRGDDFWQFMPDLLQAYWMRPQRLEALYHLIAHCRTHGMSKMGFNLGRMALKNKYPKDLLFIDRSIHEWKFWDELALCAYNCGENEEALKIGERILREKKYPDQQNARLQKNIVYFKKALSVQSDKNRAIEESNKINSKSKSDNSKSKSDNSKSKSDNSESKDNSKSKDNAKIVKTNNREFVRIDPSNKENRIALIIANYNMNERAEQMIEYIKTNVKYPCDIILVDNGSDLIEASRYTSLALGQNVQTTHAWLMGLNYCDSLETFENFKYLAYSFIITSAEIPQGQGDIISSLANILLKYPSTVGVHPSLTHDSTTHWKHMINRQFGLRLTNMIDNIFSMYRAKWFNKKGRFDPSLTYAWGIDMETSYFARKDGRKLVINDDIQVRKITNIGYSMDRMNMKSDDRFKNARDQTNKYFTQKYGTDHNQEISGKYRVPEYSALDPSLNDICQKFTEREGGHRLLMDYLQKHHLEQESILNQSKNQPFCGVNEIGQPQEKPSQKINLLEIGVTREDWEHLNSTYKLAVLAKTFDYQFWCIDADKESIQKVSTLLNLNNNIHPINAKAEDFLSNFDQIIHYVYLDGFDISLGANHHNHERVRKYRTYLDTEITNDKCYQMHLDCVYQIHQRMPVGGLICFNDIINQLDFQHKGKVAIPYLLRTGCYRIVEHKYKAILLEKIALFRKTEPIGDLIKSIEIPEVGEINDLTEISNDTDILNKFDKSKYIVTLLGYTRDKPKHTNWFPWNRFHDVFQTMNYQCEWKTLAQLSDRIATTDQSKLVPRIFICWNEPTCLELLHSGVVTPNDVIIQKLTSLGKGMESVNWTDDPKEYFKKWHWPIYQTVENLLDRGLNIYAFGCHTQTKDFPEKHRICEKLKAQGRLFWINWGSTMFNKSEIESAVPVIPQSRDFKYDLGFVGSKWGQAGRGNIDQWNKYIQPLLNHIKSNEGTVALYGSGQANGGMISDEEAKKILRQSKICPIIHAPSWIAEEGIQDRFYSVFTAGRFGVCDNPGIYEFFDKDEVVVETDPVKYIERSIYFMNHPEEQRPYIEKVQKKLKTKYNLYLQWDNIIHSIIKDKTPRLSDHQFYQKLSQTYEIDGSFYQNQSV